MRCLPYCGMWLTGCLALVSLSQLTMGEDKSNAAPAVKAARSTPDENRPFPPLSPEHEKYLNEILAYWEQTSKEIKSQSVKIERWEYDPVFGPPKAYKTYSTGIGKYQAPDKWICRIDKVLQYTPTKPSGEKPTYSRKDEIGEHWVCDGQTLFSWDYANKEFVEYKIPTEMRGRLLDFVPLKCLFQISAKEMKERYWIRVVTPKDAKGEYWLELFPRMRCDAIRFKKVEVVIDEKDFFPKAIQVYNVEYDERNNPSRTVLMLTDRVKNAVSKVPEGTAACNFPIGKPTAATGWDHIVRDEDCLNRFVWRENCPLTFWEALFWNVPIYRDKSGKPARQRDAAAPKE